MVTEVLGKDNSQISQTANVFYLFSIIFTFIPNHMG